MHWKPKLIAAAGAACAFLALGAAAPANAQVSFQLNLGTYGGPFRAPAQCYWQRMSRGPVDVVEQVCRDRFGRAYVVPGTRYTLVDYNRRQWRRWSDFDYRDWNDWNRRNPRWDWNRYRWNDRNRWDNNRRDNRWDNNRRDNRRDNNRRDNRRR